MRTNLILAAVAVLLAPLTWWTVQREGENFTEYADVPLLFPGFDPDRVTQIEISKAGTASPGTADAADEAVAKVVLQRTVEGWAIGNGMLRGVSARPAEIQNMVLQHLGRIRRDQKALIDTDADTSRLESFGLDDASALRILAYDASDGQNNVVVADLRFGKAENSGGTEGEGKARGYYVRRSDDTAVVFYETPSWFVTTDASHFADRSVARFDTSKAVRLYLSNRYGSFGVERVQANVGQWRLAKGADGESVAPEGVGPVRQTEISQLLAGLQQLRAERFVELAGGDRLEKVKLDYGMTDDDRAGVVIVTLEDGSSVGVTLGAKVPGSAERYAITNTSAFVLTVGDYNCGPFLRPVATTFFEPGRDSRGGGGLKQPRRTDSKGNKDDVDDGK